MSKKEFLVVNIVNGVKHSVTLVRAENSESAVNALLNAHFSTVERPEGALLKENKDGSLTVFAEIMPSEESIFPLWQSSL